MTTTATPAPTPEVARETRLSRVAQAIAGWTEKWFPDAYVFALVGVVVVAVAALLNGSSVATVATTFGGGFWDLTAFTLQMAMVVLGGYVVATSPPIARMINWLALRPRSGPGAVAFIAVLAMLISLLNWGLSLIFAGLLARAVARRTDITMDYRAAGAAALMGLGATWALGLSSSAAQLQATASSIPASLLPITGVLDFGKTILTWQSLLMAGVLIVLTAAVAYWSAPRGRVVTAADLGADLSDEIEVVDKRTRPGEWLEHSRILPILLGLLTLVWLVLQFVNLPFLSVISSLNAYLFVFLMLGLVLHGTPRKFLTAVNKAVPATAGILVQFPLYAAMAAILTKAEGRGGETLAHHLSSLFTSTGSAVGLGLLVGLYTVVLGVFVPSGGGKWLVEAPYVMQAATDLHLNLGWTVQIYNVAEALPNMINPFFMLPLLALLKIRARDMVGFSFIQFLFHTPVVFLMIWLLTGTFDFVPAVIP
ncbi:TIGR00366 family protein [Pseudoclavibacter soli]|uniref:TIGR00366 family protein n=1 Tax=Pseudoclavibacter soli TaxID=452623 RepID=UPI0004249D84|nr:TIGR00366 family protein [Pseudoclavibacter soli]